MHAALYEPATGRPAVAPPRSTTPVPLAQAGDAHEREADRVAAAAVAMEAAPSRPLRALAASTAGDAAVPGTGQPLPESARRWAEPRLGWSFGQVRVHADDAAARSARDAGARAYTVGRHVVLGAGEYQPGTPRGRALLAHELAHVVQQAGAPAGGMTGAAAVRTPARRSVQRTQLDVAPARRFVTRQGEFLRFPAGGHRTSSTDRPQFIHPVSAMLPYTGAGGGNVNLHPAVHSAMDRLVSAMHTEGERINDAGLRSAHVQSGYRPTALREGQAYLRSLRRTITDDPAAFPTAFPAALAAEAQSELGPTGSAAHNAFVARLGAAPGWTPAMARALVTETQRFKAPRGATTHHSGLVADIGFQYPTRTGAIQAHGTDRGRNAGAFQGAAGVWLNHFSRGFGFDTYSTSAEIWHQEWRQWQGTPADPAWVPPPPPDLRGLEVGPLPYREAREYTDCVAILGTGSRDYCRDAAAEAAAEADTGGSGPLRRRAPGRPDLP